MLLTYRRSNLVAESILIKSPPDVIIQTALPAKEPVPVEVKCSSKNLALASKYFHNLREGGFRESRLLADSELPAKIEFFENDLEHFLVILNNYS